MSNVWLHLQYSGQPTAAVEWLALVLCIRSPRVRISARRAVVLTELFCVYPQSLQANAGLVP
jgi:hypothetical protein